jgi:hypothetical protein
MGVISDGAYERVTILIDQCTNHCVCRSPSPTLSKRSSGDCSHGRHLSAFSSNVIVIVIVVIKSVGCNEARCAIDAPRGCSDSHADGHWIVLASSSTCHDRANNLEHRIGFTCFSICYHLSHALLVCTEFHSLSFLLSFPSTNTNTNQYCHSERECVALYVCQPEFLFIIERRSDISKLVFELLDNVLLGLLFGIASVCASTVTSTVSYRR